MPNGRKYKIKKNSGLDKAVTVGSHFLGFLRNAGQSVWTGVKRLSRKIGVWAGNLWINLCWVWRKANTAGKAILSLSAALCLTVLVLFFVIITPHKGTDQAAELYTPAPIVTEAPTRPPQTPDALLETAAPIPLALDGVIKKGDSNPLIVAVQQRLMDLGYMDADEPTEKFGSLTSAAIAAFQRHNGLNSDGQLGNQTYERLFADDAKEYVMQAGDSGTDVLAVKERLYQLGYLVNKPKKDVFDDETVAAVKEFQTRNKLKSADGKVGPRTLDALYDENPVSRVLQKGSTGDDVKALEIRLHKLGYLKENPDTRYGNATTEAVKAFQRANGLQADGCIGPETKELLQSPNAAPWVLTVGDSGADVKSVQARLKKLNYLQSSSAVTGYYGEVTEDAVRDFQKRNGLTEDGKVGAKTLEKLNSSNAKAAGASNTSKPTPKPSTTKPSTPKPGTTATPKPAATSTPKPSNSTGINRLIELAESRLGCPYVRGAKGSDAFDCSGLVYWCLKNAGVSVSYMTSSAWRTATRFTRIENMSDVKAGDILVFKMSATSGHVGIAISSSMMIDASSANGKVVKRAFTSAWCKNSWVCAYRIF